MSSNATDNVIETTDNATDNTPLTQAERDRMEQEAFKAGQVALHQIANDPKRRVLFAVAKVIAAECHKLNRKLRSPTNRGIKKSDFPTEAAYNAAVLKEAEMAVPDTIADVCKALPAAVQTIVADIPTLTAALALSLENPRQTIGHGLRRVEFATDTLGITADTKSDVSRRVNVQRDAWERQMAVDAAAKAE